MSNDPSRQPERERQPERGPQRHVQDDHGPSFDRRSERAEQESVKPSEPGGSSFAGWMKTLILGAVLVGGGLMFFGSDKPAGDETKFPNWDNHLVELNQKYDGAFQGQQSVQTQMKLVDGTGAALMTAGITFGAADKDTETTAKVKQILEDESIPKAERLQKANEVLQAAQSYPEPAPTPDPSSSPPTVPAQTAPTQSASGGASAPAAPATADPATQPATADPGTQPADPDAGTTGAADPIEDLSEYDPMAEPPPMPAPEPQLPTLTEGMADQIVSGDVEFFHVYLYDSCDEDGDIVEVLIDGASFAVVPITHQGATVSIPIAKGGRTTVGLRGVKDGQGGITVACRTSAGHHFARRMYEGEVQRLGTVMP